MASESNPQGGAVDQYVTDVPYTRTFIAHLAPNALRLVATLNGVAASTHGDFDYCELGCGTGDSLTTFAAAYPRARFVGVDFNAEHVAFAVETAQRGGVKNVRFLDRDVSAMSRDELPDFDFIAVHGVMSWVAPEVRRSILDFARDRLKPGGLLYASYNALPGWSAVMPLRRWLLDHAGKSGSTLDRARESMRAAQQLLDVSAVYFESHPTAVSMLKLAQQAGLPYVVHEYFHQHWYPMYFADVAREAGEHGLEYVGQLPFHLNVPSLALSEPMRAIAPPLEDRFAYESFKDFAINELFRSDVYARAPVTRSAAITRAFFETASFGTLVPVAKLRRSHALSFGPLEYTAPIYDALLPEIASTPAHARELVKREKLASFGLDAIVEALTMLTLGGQVVPTTIDANAPNPDAFNRMILRQDPSHRTLLVVASPVAGTGLGLSILDALCMRVLVEVPEGDRARWLRAYLEQHPLRIATGDQKVRDKDEMTKIVLRELDAFSKTWVEKLRALGVMPA